MAKETGLKKKVKKLNKRIKKSRTKLHKKIAQRRKTKERSEARLKLNKKVRELRKQIRWAVAKRTTLRKKLKKAKEEHAKSGKVKFESWMLNGCPSNIASNLKEPIAIGVVVYDLVVTATSNGVHSSGSYHYYSPIRGIDMASWVKKNMVAFQNKLQKKYGNKFRELFGPANWYLKNGTRYSGTFPAHDDHNHFVRDF